MKMKYLMIIALIITVMAMGAVSASDNITCDDLTVEDAIDDAAVEADDSDIAPEVTAAESEEDSVAYDGSEYTCHIQTYMDLDTFAPVVMFSPEDPSLSGTVSVYVNGTLASSKNFEPTGAHGWSILIPFFKNDLGINSLGKYEIDVRLNDELIASDTLVVSDFKFYMDVYNVQDSEYLEYGDLLYFSFEIPQTCTGSLTFTVNGRTYDVGYKNGRGVTAVDTSGWGLGKYDFEVRYGGDERYGEMTFERSFDLYPKIVHPEEIGGPGFFGIITSAGEKQSFAFIGPSAKAGNVEIRVLNSSNQQVDYKNVTLSNGYAAYSLPDLANGQYTISINGRIDGFDFSRSMRLYVINNTDDVSASVAQSEIISGGYFNLRLSGPLGSEAYVYVDDVLVKYIYLWGREVNEAISGLSVGSHSIRVVVPGMTIDECYSKTFLVTVKAKPVPDTVKMTLKKVKVKRSAKKLVLQATLKINGKAAKSKVIKFKFNKKTYKAKTNKKGVAKVTIKKKILKKLKVGKKVKIQATYGKTTKKLTVKVKK